MAMRSGLFNSEKIVETVDGFPRGDRAELADFFAKYFSSFIGNGVFPNPSTNFQVLAYDQMTMRVAPGLCWINGYFGWDVEDAFITLPVDTSAHTYRAILRLSLSTRDITLTYLTDNTALTRTETVWELAIADISVRANQITIAQSNITDLRLNGNLCGIVHGVVEQLDTTTLGNQLNGFIDNYISLVSNDYSQYLSSLEAMEEDASQKHTEFLEWVASYKAEAQTEVQSIIDSIRGILDTETAGNLLNLINAQQVIITAHESRISDLEIMLLTGEIFFPLANEENTVLVADTGEEIESYWYYEIK